MLQQATAIQRDHMAQWLAPLPGPTQDPDIANMIKISHWGLYTRNNSVGSSFINRVCCQRGGLARGKGPSAQRTQRQLQHQLGPRLSCCAAARAPLARRTTTSMAASTR
jgi:hypothetical protein